MRKYGKTISSLAICLSLGVSSAPALAMESKPTQPEPEISFDDLNAWLTFDSALPLADVLASEMSIDEFKEVSDFTQLQGLDIDTLQMNGLPMEHATMTVNGNKILFNADHSVKIGSEIMKYDSAKSSFENWKRVYTAILALPKKAEPKSASASWVWSELFAAIFGSTPSFAQSDAEYVDMKDTGFWASMKNAGGYVASYVAPGSRLYNAAVGTYNGMSESGEDISKATVGPAATKKFEETVTATGNGLAASGNGVVNGTAAVLEGTGKALERAGGAVGSLATDSSGSKIRPDSGAGAADDHALDVPLRDKAALGAGAALTWNHRHTKGDAKDKFASFKGRLACDGKRYTLFHKITDHAGAARIFQKAIPEDMLGAALKLKGRAPSCTTSTVKGYNERIARQSKVAQEGKLQKHIASARDYAHKRHPDAKTDKANDGSTAQ